MTLALVVAVAVEADSMGRVKIPYYVVKGAKDGSPGMGYWQPTKAMRAEGWRAVRCGRDGPAAWAVAQGWADKWKDSRQAEVQEDAPPRGSLAEAFARYRETPEWSSKASRTREDWERGWKHLATFHNMRPYDITLEMISLLRSAVEKRISRREAHRTIKIWRALWRVAAAMRYCDASADPSQGVRNKEPERRQALWFEGQAVRLVKGAWRLGYRGLAALMAVAWDSSLSPVDVRTLTPRQRHQDAQGTAFSLGRAKTGRAAFGTIGKRAERVLNAYLTELGVELAPSAPIFRNRSGAPYSKDTLGDDFRAVRAAVFGTGEDRKLSDFRRSGTVEAMRGGATAEEIGNKLANDFKTNANLQKTYAPVDLESVRAADEARKRGRRTGKRLEQTSNSRRNG